MEPGGTSKMIELDHGSGLRGSPAARCTTPNLVLRAESFNEHGTLELIRSCPICQAQEQPQSESRLPDIPFRSRSE